MSDIRRSYLVCCIPTLRSCLPTTRTSLPVNHHNVKPTEATVITVAEQAGAIAGINIWGKAPSNRRAESVE